MLACCPFALLCFLGYARVLSVCDAPGASLVLVVHSLQVQFFTTSLGFNEDNAHLDYYQWHGGSDTFSASESEALVRRARKAGAVCTERALSLSELLGILSAERLAIVLLDWNVVTGGDRDGYGYLGHFVVVVGFDAEAVFVHNPGILLRARLLAGPRQRIARDVFDRARTAPGTDQDVLLLSAKQPQQSQKQATATAGASAAGATIAGSGAAAAGAGRLSHLDKSSRLCRDLTDGCVVCDVLSCPG